MFWSDGFIDIYGCIPKFSCRIFFVLAYIFLTHQMRMDRRHEINPITHVLDKKRVRINLEVARRNIFKDEGEKF